MSAREELLHQLDLANDAIEREQATLRLLRSNVEKAGLLGIIASGQNDVTTALAASCLGDPSGLPTEAEAMLTAIHTAGAALDGDGGTGVVALLEAASERMETAQVALTRAAESLAFYRAML